jgi:putative DNA methylase
MLWDYTETDPLLSGPANLWAKLDRIVAGAGSIGRFQQKCEVRQAYAQSLPFADNYFDAIVTDPPYYDNIYYNVLADFFYSWKRLLLRFVEPELFASSTTDSSRELVASKFRSASQEQAHEDYCAELSLALNEAERVLKPSGVFSFVYSHSSLRGWEAIVRAFRQTRFRVTSVQPLSIERKQRPRAMTSEAVNTCITFVSHKSNGPKTNVSIEAIESKMREVAETLYEQLLGVNWSLEDTALAMFANGVAMLANVQKVRGVADNFAALRAIEKVVREYAPSFSIKDRKSL